LFGDRLARDFGDDYCKTLPREVTERAADLGGAAGTAWANAHLRRCGALISLPAPAA
jgi:hypothetical protein